MTKKKYFMIGVLALSIATLSGCVGEVKTLECTKTSDSEGMKMNELIKAEFNGNKVTNIDMNISFDTTGQQDGFAKTLEDSLKKSFDEEYGNKKCRNCKNSDHERFDNGIRHILLRRDLHIRRAQVNHKICAFELVQMQLPCQLGSKIPSIEFDDSCLFLALSSDAVCCFGGFQRGNLHKVCQEEPDADCGNHADDNL